MKSGELITMMRQHRGLNKSQLAQSLNLTRQRLQALENSKDVAFSTIVKICETLEFEFVALPKESDHSGFEGVGIAVKKA